MQKVETVNFHLTVQAARAFLRHVADNEPALLGSEYRALVRDCKTFVTRSLARDGAALFIAQTGRAYNFSSAHSRLFRDLLAGPALRPPVGLAFENIWDELSESG